MSFEWQDRDAAARTLGVDTATLQAWIDDGRAPSRTNQGRVQVLIEHLDEPAAESPPQSKATDPAGRKHTKSKANGKGDASRPGDAPRVEAVDRREDQPPSTEPERNAASASQGAGAGAERVHATTTDVELVSKRELQLAGGMIAAWQRLAETSNQDLARARKVGVLSWSLVAAMVVLGGVGLWLSTQSVTDAKGRLDSTQEKLASAEKTVADTQSRAASLQAEVSQRTADLAEANARLAATIERINLSKSQSDQLAAQHLLTKQLADKQAETSKSLAQTLQATIDDQRQRIAALDKELAASRQAVADLTADAAALRKKDEERAKLIEARTASLDEMTTQRDALKKQLDQLTSDHAAAMKTIDNLKKEMAGIKAEMERTKTAEK